MTEAQYSQSQQDEKVLPEVIYTVYEASRPGRPVATSFSAEAAIREKDRQNESRVTSTEHYRISTYILKPNPN